MYNDTIDLWLPQISGISHTYIYIRTTNKLTVLEIIINNNYSTKNRETTNKLTELQMVIYNSYDERLEIHTNDIVDYYIS